MRDLQFGIKQSVCKAPNGNPSNVVLAVLSDNSIRVTHTNGATNQDGTYYYYSLDGVTGWTLGYTIVGNGTTGDITGLTPNSDYYVKAVHYKGSKLSNYSSIVNILTTTILPYYSAIPASTPLTIPNPYSDNTSIHPYVKDFLLEHGLTTWNGYRYWMIYTPYGITTGSDEENPCIAVSSDKTTWVTPDGLTNPLEPQPSPTTYNADVTWFFNEITNTLYCIFRSLNAYLYEKHTTDGITWTNKVLILQYYTGDGNHTNDKYVAPSFVKYGNLIYMFSTDYAKSDTVYVSSCATINGTWSAPSAITIDKTKSCFAEIDGQQVNAAFAWHTEMRYYKGVWFLLIFYENILDVAGIQYLWMATGATMNSLTLSKYPIISKAYDANTASAIGDFKWDMSYYKSSFIPYVENGILKFELFYTGEEADVSNNHVYQCGHTTIQASDCGLNFNDADNTINASRIAELAVANTLVSPYVFCDDCNRANGAVNPSSCGLNWTAVSSGVFLIQDNYIINGKGGVPPTGTSFDYVTVPVNYEATIQMINGTVMSGTGDGFPRFYLKYISATQYLGLVEGKKYSKGLYTVGGGTSTEIARFYRLFKKGELVTYRIVVNGDNVQIWVNGVRCMNVTLTDASFKDSTQHSQIMAATKFGIELPTATNVDMIKNITIKSL